MVYEDEGGDLPPAYPAGGGFRSKLSYHFEGLIPLILILIIAAVAGAWLGFFDLPLISPRGPVDMLVIGSPSVETLQVLDNSKDLVQYRVIEDVEALRTNSKDKLAQYNIVMLDQTNSPQKILPSTVGEALNSYVAKGGKLIVVKNSGIYNPEAPEIVGWMANFGSDVVPVECITTRDNYPSCTVSVNVSAELERADFKSPIMRGIEKVPATPDQPYLYLEVFPVAVNGHEIATIRDVQSTKYYAGIVEKRLLIGKSIYFNYNPGYTPGIFRNVLKYLR